MGKGTWPNPWGSGLAADRPAAGDVGEDAYYYATDTGVLSRSDGASTWTTLGTLYVVGGTDVAVADGGTGASTAAAAATNLGLGTGDSPQFTAVNIGHASDTTLARASAGNLTVEGNALYRAGGTDVPIADGGTGASTKAAAFDALSPMTTSGDTIYGGASGTGTRLAKGSDGQVLTLASGLPSWATPASGFANPMTTQDDIIVGGASGTPGRLAKGTDGQVLTVDPSTHHLVWATPSGGGGSLTVEEVDGSPTDSAVTKIVFPNGTLGIASHVATYTPAGGGTASIAQSFVGYDTVGASTENITNDRQYMKQITIASASVLTGVSAYIKQSASGSTVDLNAAVLTDVAGAPGIIIARGYSGQHFLSTSNGSAGAARWFAVPVDVYLPAGTYWIAFQLNASNTHTIAYDSGGSDQYFTNGALDRMSDSGWTTVTTSSNRYSIRASVIAAGGGLTVSDEGTPLSTAATTLDFVGAGVTASGAGATKTVTIPGGGITQAYAGYNTAGGSWDTTAANNRGYAKSITLANDCLITSIGAYVQTASTTSAGGPHVALYTDSGGAPSLLIGQARGASAVVLTGTTPRWMELPLGIWVPAGTYWIAVQVSAVGFGVILQVAYDGSGSDKTFAGGDFFFDDWASYTSTGTSNKFSLRANTIR